MVQLQTPQQAALAMQYLSNCELFGQPISISVSRHLEVALPNKPEESPLTKDYTGSKLHRFRVPASKNARHIFHPSPVLHVSNLPENTTEDQLKGIFEQGLDEKDAGQVRVSLFGQERRMAYVTMPSISVATHALIRCHDYALREKNLRVTFSQLKEQQPQPQQEQPLQP